MNVAYAIGGPQLVVRTVETLTGARVDHVAMIDFRGFVGLTKDLGGVTVRNRIALSSHGFTLGKGDIQLEGDAAMWYVRGAGADSASSTGPRTSGMC
jgi:LCP family protein required for cell wall assembly